MPPDWRLFHVRRSTGKRLFFEVPLSGSQRMRAMAIGVQLHFYPRESEEIARVVCIFLALLPKSVM
jgi:hypothetical protein